MMNLVIRRVGWSIIVLWFVVTATFVMVAALPADPANTLLGPHATPEAIARVRGHYCLDRGVLAQYRCYVGNLLHGDLGESFRSKRAVSAILADRLWPTAQLAIAAIALQIAFGVPLGTIAALRHRRWPDHASNAFVVVAQSAPPFVVGTLFLYIFAYRFGWFPINGYGFGLWSRLHHLVLPAATLATLGIAYYAKLVRSELIEVLAADYVRTARAKGSSEWNVVMRHALRNAVGPLISLVGIDLGVLAGGAVAVEYIFAWPGIGREVLQAILEVDIPLILGVVMVTAIAVTVANALTDVVALCLDPRARG